MVLSLDSKETVRLSSLFPAGAPRDRTGGPGAKWAGAHLERQKVCDKNGGRGIGGGQARTPPASAEGQPAL